MRAANDHLPLQLSSFIGREREIVEVKRLLSTARLVTLTGAGGCGKTALALRVARDLPDAYPNGAWWIELAPLTDPALLPQAINYAFGIVEQPNRAPIDVLSDYVREKELLLVLDNCEHMIDACAALVGTLLQQSPDLHILATSREALNIAGEFAWIVPSLGFPASNSQPAVSTLQQYDSVRLFIERACAVQSDFKLTGHNAPAIAQICQRVDGMPLAIELAAARVKYLGVEQIASRLEDAMGLLTEGKRNAPARHQALRATMDWSYGLLSPAERSLFRRLSVFAGGFTLQAAEIICVRGNPEIERVLNVLARLVDKSLVVKQEQHGNVRYRMLEPIRQYALERLDQSGETENIRNRHLQYFLSLAETAELKLASVERDIWRTRLEADYDNLRAAHEFSQAIDDPESELRLAGALTWFWVYGNYQGEGRHWLAGALVRAGGLLIGTTTRAKVLFGAGRLAAAIGPYPVARARLAESVELFKELGDRRRAAYALISLAYTTAAISGDAKARVLSEESVRTARELGDKWLLTLALADLGNTLARANHPAARPVLEEALALAREQREKMLIAMTLAHLAELELRERNFAAARAHREEMLALYRELGSKHGVALALGGLGEGARFEGNYAQAEMFYEESQVISRAGTGCWLESA